MPGLKGAQAKVPRSYDFNVVVGINGIDVDVRGDQRWAVNMSGGDLASNRLGSLAASLDKAPLPRGWCSVRYG